MPTDVVKMDGALQSLPEPSSQPEMTALLRLAIQEKMPVEALEKLVALSERMADRLAAQEFHRALSEFQNECPAIPKVTKATIRSQSGTGYEYRYAELDTIAAVVNPLLSKRGLSYTWDSEAVTGGQKVRCTLHHTDGHFKAASFTALASFSGGMSDGQKQEGALKVGMRQSLILVLGLTTCLPPEHEALGATEAITEQQVADLNALIVEVKADKAKFLTFLGVGNLADIRAADFGRAVRGLEDKRRKL
jgi:hypothetical protein